MEEIYFFAAFLVCFISYVLHTESHYSAARSRNPRFPERFIEISVVVGYFAWISMMFSDPLKFQPYPVFQMPLGIIVGIAGIAVIAKAHKQKEGFSETEKLVNTGVYSKIRHPLYFGMMLAYIGFPIAFGCMMTLASAAVWGSFAFTWKTWEEKELVRRFGNDYIEYKKKTLF
jgi:protein-S-isoprenylcysteine O-methyltransferase Ste14